MVKTRIEWTENSWNPVTGCTKISPGCKNCYAERIAARFAGRNFPAKPDHFKVTLRPERLDQPLHMKLPRMIFVCSMGDLFHKDVPADYIVQVFEVMAACPQHTFQVLTKRPERIREVLFGEEGHWYLGGGDYYPNIWIGFTAENQEMFDKRWPIFCAALGTEYFTTFISLEPLLGPITPREPVLTAEFHPSKVTHCKPLDWVIVGGETGPGARIAPGEPLQKSKCKMQIAKWEGWARDIRDQCKAANIPFFGKKAPGGGELPPDLKIREWPKGENDE